jgi:hypothetical protein
MNEQGAHYFDRYQDSDGISAVGKEIGIWDQVGAANATFVDLDHQISFSLPQVDGANLYRGRELIGRRLAWSGFGYSFPLYNVSGMRSLSKNIMSNKRLIYPYFRTHATARFSAFRPWASAISPPA